MRDCERCDKAKPLENQLLSNANGVEEKPLELFLPPPPCGQITKRHSAAGSTPLFETEF